MFILIITITSGVLVELGGSVQTVVGLVGYAVTLPCEYDVAAHGISNVCWGRGQSLFSCEHTLVSTGGLKMSFRKSSRYSLSSQLYTGDASLTINKAQSADAGFYICRVEVPGLFNDISLPVYLIVVTHKKHLFNIITYAADDMQQTTVPEGQNHIFTDKTVSPTAAEIQTQGQVKLFSTTTDTDVSTTATEMKEQDFTGEPRVGSVKLLLHNQDNMEAFITTTVRSGAVIFIPGLIVALMWKLRRIRKYGNGNVEEKRLHHNINHHMETPQEEV